MAKNVATRRLIREKRRERHGRGSGGTSLPRWMQAIIALCGLFIVALAVAGATGYGVYQSYASDLKSPEELLAQQPAGGAKIYDRNGRLLYEYIDDRSGLRAPVSLEDISPFMIAATISTEDYNYWSNPGVNWRGLARAGLEQLGLREADAATSTGGSSITQQLVKNIYIPEEERAERSYTRKLKETIYAIELTDRYSKDQILEWYLNQISYGGLYYGVEAASLGYFGKSAKDLTLEEAALLAGIPACPSCYDPINNPEEAVARRNRVMQLMRTRDRTTVDFAGEDVPASKFQISGDGTEIAITDLQFYLATLTPLNIAPQRFPVQAPHWVFEQIQPELEARFGREALYRGGLRVTTTIDLDLQEKAEEVLETWISEFEASADGHNGALVALDPRTSEVLAYVGSRDYFRDDIQGRVDNANSFHSPGSTLKPFAYAAAFEQLGWGTDSLILDTPISVPDRNGEPFSPRNPNGGYAGPISIRNALGNSLNIPAFKTSLYLGVDKVEEIYRRFGMTGIDGENYGPSITIGGIDIKLIDVAYAYTVFANNGVMRGVPTPNDYGEGYRDLDPVKILQVVRESDQQVLYPETDDNRVKVEERRIIDAGHAFMINDILSDPNAFCITYGCGALSIGREWAVKTGTSEPYENSSAIGETWTYGYTPELVAGVWAGNADNSPMFNITSTSISYRALRDFMVAALADTPPSTFQRPPEVVEMDICVPSNLKADADCGRRVRSLMSKTNAPQKDDDWWRRVRVDIRDGLLATERTPPQFVQERFGLAIPAEGLSDFARQQAQEWARVLNAGRAPEQESTGDAPLQITSPRQGQRISGTVFVTGKIDVEDFVAYRVEFGQGNPPLAWQLLIRETALPSSNGLAIWNTSGLPAGTYTLRVVVETATRGELSTFVVVTVRDSGGDEDEDEDNTPAPLPTPTPDFRDLDL
ncbi:MAG TPA: transglycosylase domain-containing protein [Dehalococcoidia bacterium]|nr:transglycosylase domain-containing protein [Dehalococcoidia bacterium]